MSSESEQDSRYPRGERTAVGLPNTLVADIDDRIRGTAFGSPGEYITFVLEEVLLELDEVSEPNGETLNEDEVEERLQALGYLNE